MLIFSHILILFRVKVSVKKKIQEIFEIDIEISFCVIKDFAKLIRLFSLKRIW